MTIKFTIKEIIVNIYKEDFLFKILNEITAKYCPKCSKPTIPQGFYGNLVCSDKKCRRFKCES